VGLEAKDISKQFIAKWQHQNTRKIPGRAKCPECGIENVKSKLSFTNIMAWVCRILGVLTVKIFEKRCMGCGHEFQVFRK
jgi:ribosomal protein S14